MKAEVRLANETDGPIAAEFFTSTPDNLLDMDISAYPSLRVLAVDVNDKPSVFVPFHPVIVVESIGHRPDITPRENAYALRKLQDALEATAHMYHMSEIYWQCSDISLVRLAMHHGYEVLIRNKADRTAEEIEQIISSALDSGLVITLKKKVSPNA